MLVVFDCDGVLVDSEEISNRTLAESLADVGLRLTTQESIDEFQGRSWTSVAARIEELLGGPVPADLAATYDEARDRAFRAELEPVAGVVAALDAVEGAGHTTCVASSGDHEKMQLTLGLTDLLPRFEGRIFSATEVEHGKPAPDLFLHAARQMGFLPRHCVVIEDSPVGVRAGRAAGMKVLGYAGMTPAGSLEAAHRVFTSMWDLPRLVA